MRIFKTEKEIRATQKKDSDAEAKVALRNYGFKELPEAMRSTLVESDSPYIMVANLQYQGSYDRFPLVLDPKTRKFRPAWQGFIRDSETPSIVVNSSLRTHTFGRMACQSINHTERGGFSQHSTGIQVVSNWNGPIELFVAEEYIHNPAIDITAEKTKKEIEECVFKEAEKRKPFRRGAMMHSDLSRRGIQEMFEQTQEVMFLQGCPAQTLIDAYILNKN